MSSVCTLLVVSHQAGWLGILSHWARAEFTQCVCREAETATAALALARAAPPDLLLVDDAEWPEGGLQDFLHRLRQSGVAAPVIILSQFSAPPPSLETRGLADVHFVSRGRLFLDLGHQVERLLFKTLGPPGSAVC